MAACTPDARDMTQGRNGAPNAPHDPFDLKGFELLDDMYNGVSATARRSLISAMYRIRCGAQVCTQEAEPAVSCRSTTTQHMAWMHLKSELAPCATILSRTTLSLSQSLLRRVSLLQGVQSD